MRTLLLFCWLCTCVPAQVTAQEDLTHLTIGVYMKPNSYQEIDPAQLTKLETRIINAISSNGMTYNISASRIEPDTVHMNDPAMMETMARGVVCFPKFELYDTKRVDTGLKKMTVVDASLTLTVQYIHEDIIFNTMSVQLQGSGTNQAQAINDIIRNIRARNPRWAQFLNQTRERIVNYYDTHCSSIVEKARQLERLDLPLEAVQILWPIPEEVDCYEEVKEMTVGIYRKYINKQCRQYLLVARTQLAGNDYKDGLATLQKIDPSSQCFEEAMALVGTIEQEIDKVDSDNRDAKMRLQADLARSEQQRTSRMQESVARQNAPLLQQTILTKD